MLRAPDVLIAGSGRLAKEAETALRAGHRRVVRIDFPDRSIERLRDGATLIVTAHASQDPAPGWSEGWNETWTALAVRSGKSRRSMPRVLLLSDAREPLPPTPPDPEYDSGPRFEQLILEPIAARLLLARWPLHLGCDPLFGQQIHLVVAGRTPLADALLLHALRIAHYSERAPVITLLCDFPECWRRDFIAAYPQAESFCRLRFRLCDDPALGGEAPVCAAFVCAEPAEVAVVLAESLKRLIAEQERASPPILLDVGDAEPGGRVSDWDGQIVPFSYRRMALTPAVLLDGRGDELAQVIHEHYRDTSAAQGRAPDSEPSSRPWSQLDDAYRFANRHQADHLWAKLAVTDCRAIPEDLVDSFAFAPAEVERLSVIEHARWAADRYLDGWSYAPERSNADKHHPQLVPYAELSTPMKDLDRFAVRLVPALLARSGLGLVRMLIVGATGSLLPGEAGPRTGRLRALVDQVLQRLRARYPDRGLIVAATLADPASRLFARRALRLADAGLFLLCPRPLAETLEAQPDAGARDELLGLVARAERRVPLPTEGDLGRWLAARAEIHVEFAPEQAASTQESESKALIRKRVRIDMQRSPEWNFEY